MAEKDFFIHSAELVDFNDSTNVPTVIRYQAGQNSPLIGCDALAAATRREQLNEDFKVDLGNFKPGIVSNQQFATFDGKRRSAGELTGDFLNELIVQARSWLAGRDLKSEVGILVAEPLSMQDDLVSTNWLGNYRNSVRKILLGKGFDKVDFLPEPFAVYQYYRYGVRHPLLTEQRKQHALVLDFGGGTFDVCLIETTRTGDVWERGRAAKPLSASSKAVGGYFVNRVIAEYLLRKVLSKSNMGHKANKSFESYARWRKEGTDLGSLAPEYQAFIKQFTELTHRVEEAKLTLSRCIVQWKLDAVDSVTVPVSIPINPFVEESGYISIQFSAGEFKALFVDKIWPAELRQVVKLTLERGREESNGAPVSVVLMSGGSANIRWLGELLRRDFADQLSGAEVLSIKDFQEVVSKGLALECARRYYTPEGLGDFSATTYNRLCLLLDPNDSGCSVRKFTPRDSGLPQTEIPGVLLPSASVLKNFKDKPMRWKVRLDTAPSRHLSYFFLKSSFDPNDTPNLQNVEETRLHTASGTRFDSQLSVELRVSEDGTTATPRFIYYSGQTSSDAIYQDGRSFFLDMTSSETNGTATAFLGLDFGTSNTSMSYVSHERIQTYERRSQEGSWNELSDLASSLPYPLAGPLAQYLSQTDSSRLATAAREFVECSLTIAAYIAYQDLCSNEKRSDTKFFKALSKRSAGPIWKLFREVMLQLGTRASASGEYRALLEPAFYKEIDETVDRLAQQKHGKASDASMHALRPVQILANVSQKVFAKHYFGTFHQVKKQRFGTLYSGSYRIAHGRPPFIRVSDYSGTISFSDNEAFLISKENGVAIPLEPLIVWHPCLEHPELEHGHCYLYDGFDREGCATFKAVGYTCVFTSKKNDTNPGLYQQLCEMQQKDQVVTRFQVNLTDTSADAL